jgi:hypothetical protein
MWTYHYLDEIVMLTHCVDRRLISSNILETNDWTTYRHFHSLRQSLR